MGILKTALVKISLPISLFTASILRFNLFSGIYLVSFLLILPFGKGYKMLLVHISILLVFSILFTLGHICIQITIIFYPRLLNDCSDSIVNYMHQIGISNLHKSSFSQITRIVIPDAWMAVICTLCLIITRRHRIRKYLKMSSRIDLVNSRKKKSTIAQRNSKIWSSWLYQRIKIFLNLTLVGFVGIISPSVLNFTYLLLFMTICTLWASGFNFSAMDLYYLRVFVLTYNGIHIILWYITQFEIFQIYFPNGHLTNRLLGLYYSINSSCKLKGGFELVPQRISDYLNPFILALLYYIYSLDSNIWIDKETLHNLATIANTSSRTYQSPDIISRKSTVENTGDYNVKHVNRPLLSSILNSFIRNSYIFTFIAMMVWSITYRSWLTFMLLILASILWLIPNSRAACLFLSPGIVAYGILLIIFNYISNINSVEIYNLLSSNFYGDLSEFGLFRWDIPLISLSFTIGYLLIFWLTLRLFSKERRSTRKSKNENPIQTQFKDDVLFRRFVVFIQNLCAKYWIFVCVFVLLIFSIQKEVKACYIIYIVLMSYFLTLFMFSYTLWRKQMYIIWWLFVLYSLLLLFGIYTYQFKIFRILWHSYTIFSPSVLSSFGFESYLTTKLFEGLWIPVVFLVVTIIQVHYFHDSFMKISGLTNRRIVSHEHHSKEFNLRKSTSSISAFSHNFMVTSLILLLVKWRRSKSPHDKFVVEINYFVNDVNSAFNLLSRNLTKLFNNIYLKIWRLFEVHFTKMVILCVIIYTIDDVNAFNCLLIVLIVLFYPFQNLHGLLIFITFILLAIQIIFKMCYQLPFFSDNLWRSNCSHLIDNFGNPYPEDMDNLQFIGLIKYDNFRSNSWFSVYNMLLCCIWYVIKYHQDKHFNTSHFRRPEKGIIFPDFSHSNLDHRFLNFVKFLLNFAFYKLGLELCFIVTVINAYVRMDALSIGYLLLLMIFLLSSRLFCSKLWILYIFILIILIPFQYCLCLDFFPMLCKNYPQTFVSLKYWVFYSSDNKTSNEHKIIGDVIQMMFAISQHHVFLIEKSTANYKGGDNRPILANEMPQVDEQDFMSSRVTYADYLKQVTFYWFYWLSLAVIFLNGIMRNTVYCFGYMILATVYFWIGQRILLHKRKYLLSMWNVILFYNFFIIMIKSILHIVGCIIMAYILKKRFCWMIQLFGIMCFEPKFENITVGNITSSECEGKHFSMRWDIACFIMLILQRKILVSKLFCFVVLHLKIQSKFASRGAQLINRKLIAILKDEKRKENQIFGKIKGKILDIEQTHQNYGKPLPNEHYLVLRSGDYFLFDGNPEDEDKDNLQEHTDTTSSLYTISDHRMSYMQAKSNIKHFLKREEDETTSIMSKLELIPPMKRKVNLTEYTEIGNIGRNRLVLNENVSNQNNRAKKENYTVINPRRSSSKSDDSYHTPVSETDRTQRVRPLRLPYFNKPDLFTKRSDFSGNSRAPLTMTVRRKKSLSDIITDAKAHEDGFWSKSKSVFSTCYNFFIMCLMNLIKWINLLTQDSRNVSIILDTEKQVIKKKIISCANGEWIGKHTDQFFILTSQGQTLGIDYIMESYYTTTADIFKRPYRVVELIYINVEIFENQTVFSNNMNNENNVESKPEDSLDTQSSSKLFLLLVSLGNLFIIYSEMFCYVILVFNHMYSFNLLSLVYPLSVFLWAMLSVPRPSTFYWMFIILYTQIVIATKYIFQFNFIDFSIGEYAFESSNPFFLPVILGIQKIENYALIDLIQLLILFLHRGYLKDNGLWKGFTDDTLSDKFETMEPASPKRNVILTILCSPLKRFKLFYDNLITYRYSKRVDFYVYMFIFEFLSFFIIVFGYKTFGSQVGSASTALDFIKENKIPVQFIMMLITQFVFMIIDRALFLRKQVTGKLFFLIFYVILIHVWIFFINPYVSRSKFNAHMAPQLLYFVKCLYFAISAYQIKSGYPLRILGNFLTKNFNYVNLILFKAYMVVPFLYELRNVMDWIWTDTSVSLYHWMEIEDIFTKVFVLKCWRRAELEYPTPRGHNRWYVSKVIVGGLSMTFFFLCLWGPLTIGTIIGATFVRNPPIKCVSVMEVDGFSMIYQFSSRNQNLKTLDEASYGVIKNCYKENLAVLNYLKSFDFSDVTMLKLGLFSEDIWSISPPNLKRFVQMLSDPSLNPQINSIIDCERIPSDTSNTNVHVSVTHTRLLTEEERINLSNMILNRTNTVVLKDILPKFIVARKTSMHFMSDKIPLNESRFLSIELILRGDNTTMWFEIKELPSGNCSQPTSGSWLPIYALSERISDSLIGKFFSRYGILGMYAAYILVAHRLLRAIYADISYIIRCEELPYVDRILSLLNEIYLVRENKMFRLEEQLVAKLIFLYRSSETMIKWTRHPQSTLKLHMD